MTNPIMPPGPARLTADGQCPHQPPCPGALEPDRLAARLVARYPDQGWSVLCTEWWCSTTATSYFQAAGSSPRRRVPVLP